MGFMFSSFLTRHYWLAKAVIIWSWISVIACFFSLSIPLLRQLPYFIASALSLVLENKLVYSVPSIIGLLLFWISFQCLIALYLADDTESPRVRSLRDSAKRTLPSLGILYSILTFEPLFSFSMGVVKNGYVGTTASSKTLILLLVGFYLITWVLTIIGIFALAYWLKQHDTRKPFWMASIQATVIITTLISILVDIIQIASHAYMA